MNKLLLNLCFSAAIHPVNLLCCRLLYVTFSLISLVFCCGIPYQPLAYPFVWPARLGITLPGTFSNAQFIYILYIPSQHSSAPLLGGVGVGAPRLRFLMRTEHLICQDADKTLKTSGYFQNKTLAIMPHLC